MQQQSRDRFVRSSQVDKRAAPFQSQEASLWGISICWVLWLFCEGTAIAAEDSRSPRRFVGTGCSAAQVINQFDPALNSYLLPEHYAADDDRGDDADCVGGDAGE